MAFRLPKVLSRCAKYMAIVGAAMLLAGMFFSWFRAAYVSQPQRIACVAQDGGIFVYKWTGTITGASDGLTLERDKGQPRFPGTGFTGSQTISVVFPLVHFGILLLFLALMAWLQALYARDLSPIPPRDHCQRCGYPIDGLPRCPECGQERS